MDHISVEVQTEGPEVSTVGLITDVSSVQVVRETTYALMTSHPSSAKSHFRII